MERNILQLYMKATLDLTGKRSFIIRLLINAAKHIFVCFDTNSHAIMNKKTTPSSSNSDIICTNTFINVHIISADSCKLVWKHIFL